MTDDLELRDKDQAVLHAIQKGHNDTQKITQETTLKNHHVRYALKKLEKQGLIHLEKPDGMTERIINGQKRVFQTPLQAQTTEKGLQTLKESNQEDLEAYENLTHKELVEKTQELEDRVNKLENMIKVIRNQFHRTID